jgi:predicted amidohydrolase
VRTKIALVQSNARLGDVDFNLSAHEASVAEARRHGAGLIVFPELSLTGYLLQDMVPDVAIGAGDARWRKLAQAAGEAELCVGAIEEAATGAQYISAFHVDARGVRNVHRKVYLASYGLFDEARYVGEGHRVRALDSKFGRIGICICEDAWHPSLLTALLLDGAQLVIVQTASPVRDLRDDALAQNAQTWIDTLRTYARLFGVYIAFCNRVGSEDGLVFWGGSVVLGPEGETVAEGPLYDESLVYAQIDWERVRQARLANPVLREERIDLTIRELTRIQSGLNDASIDE